MSDSSNSYHRDYYYRVTKPKRQARAGGSTQKGPCHYCGEVKTLTVDHVVPRVRGGSDSEENIVLACYWCNMSKGGQLLEEWRFSIAKKLAAWPEFRPMQIEWLCSHGFDPEAIAIALLPQVKFAFEGGSTLKQWSATARHRRENSR